MSLDTVTTILVAVAPAVTAAVTIIGGIIKIKSMFKKEEEKRLAELERKTAKMEKSFDDIAILKTKIESIERHLLNEKERKK